MHGPSIRACRCSIAAIRVSVRVSRWMHCERFCWPTFAYPSGSKEIERVTRSVTAHAESARCLRALCDVDVCIFALQTTEYSRVGESKCLYWIVYILFTVAWVIAVQIGLNSCQSCPVLWINLKAINIKIASGWYFLAPCASGIDKYIAP